MKNEWLDLIDGYLAKTLSKEELKLFKEKINTNPDFKKTFLEEQRMWEGVKYANHMEIRKEVLVIKEQLESGEKTPVVPFFSKKNWYSSLRYIGVAASILMIIGIPVYRYNTVDSRQQEQVAAKDAKINKTDSNLNFGEKRTLKVIRTEKIKASSDGYIYLIIKEIEQSNPTYTFQKDTLLIYGDNNYLKEGVFSFSKNVQNGKSGILTIKKDSEIFNFLIELNDKEDILEMQK